MIERELVQGKQPAIIVLTLFDFDLWVTTFAFLRSSKQRSLMRFFSIYAALLVTVALFNIGKNSLHRPHSPGLYLDYKQSLKTMKPTDAFHTVMSSYSNSG